MNYPIIRLEVDRMKHSIVTALTELAALMDSSGKKAVEAYCTEENIDAVVRKAAMEALDAAVKEEVRNFFGYSGQGRLAVREAVEQFLNKNYPLDGK